MKIAFVSEFFLPFSAGGAEWSTYLLAQSLIKQGLEVTIITPDLSTKVSKLKVDVKRYPFYKKLNQLDKFPGNFFFTNPLWVIWSAFFLYIYLKRENPDVVHIHGKYSIPPAVLANYLLKKPMVATVRDNIVICNYGICLMKRDKACNLKEYFLKDFIKYMEIYVDNKGLVYLFKNFSYALWGRLSRNVLRFSLNGLERIIVLSENQRQIFLKNGIRKKIVAIPSIIEFKNKLPSRREKIILYAGRLTYGKGITLLLEAYTKFSEKLKGFKLVIAGLGKLPKSFKKDSKTNREFSYLGHISRAKLQEYFKKSYVTVVPSIWPDPLPRVALESIGHGTPIVATNKGGLPQIAEDGLFGVLSEPTPASLTKAIEKGILRNDLLRKNIQDNFERLKKKYSHEIAEKHISLYNSLIK